MKEEMKKLAPWYISGIIEGEGSFCVSFNLKKRLKLRIETRPSFSITLNENDYKLLKKIREYFKCGAIRYNKGDRTYKFETRSINEIVDKIIPHFFNYPLQGKKQKDFLKFQKICKMIHTNLHITRKHLLKIIEIAYSMNPSGKRKYKKEDLLKELDKVKV